MANVLQNSLVTDITAGKHKASCFADKYYKFVTEPLHLEKPAGTDESFSSELLQLDSACDNLSAKATLLRTMAIDLKKSTEAASKEAAKHTTKSKAGKASKSVQQLNNAATAQINGGDENACIQGFAEMRKKIDDMQDGDFSHLQEDAACMLQDMLDAGVPTLDSADHSVPAARSAFAAAASVRYMPEVLNADNTDVAVAERLLQQLMPQTDLLGLKSDGSQDAEDTALLFEALGLHDDMQFCAEFASPQAQVTATLPDQRADDCADAAHMPHSETAQQANAAMCSQQASLLQGSVALRGVASGNHSQVARSIGNAANQSDQMPTDQVQDVEPMDIDFIGHEQQTSNSPAVFGSGGGGALEQDDCLVSSTEPASDRAGGTSRMQQKEPAAKIPQQGDQRPDCNFDVNELCGITFDCDEAPAPQADELRDAGCKLSQAGNEQILHMQLANQTQTAEGAQPAAPALRKPALAGRARAPVLELRAPGASPPAPALALEHEDHICGDRTHSAGASKDAQDDILGVAAERALQGEEQIPQRGAAQKQLARPALKRGTLAAPASIMQPQGSKPTLRFTKVQKGPAAAEELCDAGADEDAHDADFDPMQHADDADREQAMDEDADAEDLASKDAAGNQPAEVRVKAKRKTKDKSGSGLRDDTIHIDLSASVKAAWWPQVLETKLKEYQKPVKHVKASSTLRKRSTFDIGRYLRGQWQVPKAKPVPVPPAIYHPQSAGPGLPAPSPLDVSMTGHQPWAVLVKCARAAEDAATAGLEEAAQTARDRAVADIELYLAKQLATAQQAAAAAGPSAKAHAATGVQAHSSSTYTWAQHQPGTAVQDAIQPSHAPQMLSGLGAQPAAGAAQPPAHTVESAQPAAAQPVSFFDSDSDFEIDLDHLQQVERQFAGPQLGCNANVLAPQHAAHAPLPLHAACEQAGSGLPATVGNDGHEFQRCEVTFLNEQPGDAAWYDGSSMPVLMAQPPASLCHATATDAPDGEAGTAQQALTPPRAAPAGFEEVHAQGWGALFGDGQALCEIDFGEDGAAAGSAAAQPAPHSTGQADAQQANALMAVEQADDMHMQMTQMEVTAEPDSHSSPTDQAQLHRRSVSGAIDPEAQQPNMPHTSATDLFFDTGALEMDFDMDASPAFAAAAGEQPDQVEPAPTDKALCPSTAGDCAYQQPSAAAAEPAPAEPGTRGATDASGTQRAQAQLQEALAKPAPAVMTGKRKRVIEPHMLQDLMADVLRSKAPAQSPLQNIVDALRATLAGKEHNEPHAVQELVVATRQREPALRASAVRWLLACFFLVSQTNKAQLSEAAGGSHAGQGGPQQSTELPLGSGIRLLKRSAPTDKQLNLFVIVDA